jgi:hypothetical protein
MLGVPDERMHEDDATRDGLPRFIYGEYTGETRLPERLVADEDGGDEGAAKPMDRNTKILVASGGVALVFIVGLVIAALSTGGAGETPAAANAESPASSTSSAGVPSPTEAPGGASPSWPMATDLSAVQGSSKPTKTANPTTAKPGTTPAVPTTKPTRTTKPTKTPTKPTIIFPPPR